MYGNEPMVSFQVAFSFLGCMYDVCLSILHVNNNVSKQAPHVEHVEHGERERERQVLDCNVSQAFPDIFIYLLYTGVFCFL